MLLHHLIFAGVVPLKANYVPLPGGGAVFGDGGYVGLISETGLGEMFSTAGGFLTSSAGVLGGETYLGVSDPDLSGYSSDAVFGSGTEHFTSMGERLGWVEPNVDGGFNLYSDHGLVTSSHAGFGGTEVFDSAAPAPPDLDMFCDQWAPQLPDMDVWDVADAFDMADLDGLADAADFSDLVDAGDWSDLFDLLDLF